MPETFPHAHEPLFELQKEVIELPSRLRIKQRLGMLANRHGGREFNQQVARRIANFSLQSKRHPTVGEYVDTTRSIISEYAVGRGPNSLLVEYELTQKIDTQLISDGELETVGQYRTLIERMKDQPE